MQVACPHCRRVVEFSGERPSFCGYCGQPLPKEEVTLDFDPDATKATPKTGKQDEAAPETLGGYRLLRRIGSGGMGTVYEAEHSSSGRRVALKLVSPEFATSSDTVERFRQEGRLASAIAHPRCVFVLAADEEAGRPFIVMELMPGSTLKDLIEKHGPLTPEQAIPKILDVIEGLQEAHRLGVIHRDVKPSNCFLEADGRVKVGDFGLSKSLMSESHLTRTGTFLGTPLFASPEQVKGEPVDPQTDVYSVAATLYFLLTGQAPFQTKDAAATLARIAADDPPSLRALRPAIPKALDRVVLRGLERTRERRWRDLEEFRKALLPFVPGHLSIGGMGIRFGAFVIDYLVLMLVGMVFGFAVFFRGDFKDFTEPQTETQIVQTLVGFLIWVLYFGVPEGIWGCSLGKRLLRLRVCAVGESQPPGLGKALLRAAVFVALLDLGAIAATVGMLLTPADMTWEEVFRQMPGLWLFISVASLGGMILGIALMLAPMRARNGYRGLHELLSGTRVVGLPWPERRSVFAIRPAERPLLHPAGMPGRLGSFTVQGALAWTPAEAVLLGGDESLERKVWIWLRPQSEPPLSPERRELSRTTRLRWLSCGAQDGWQWDAFLFAPGWPLGELVAMTGRLPWPDVRPILQQLAEELVAADQDGTLPQSLSLDQVWIQANGRVVLLDSAPDGAPLDEQHKPRLLGLPAAAAVLLLEGHPRTTDQGSQLRAPLPGHAAQLLGRLLGREDPFSSVKELRAELQAAREKPTEVTRLRRAAHLGLAALLLLIPFCSCIGPGLFMTEFMVPVGLYFQVSVAEQMLANFDEGACADAAAWESNPDPYIRLAGALQFEKDQRLRAQVAERLERDRAKAEAARHSAGWLPRAYLDFLEQAMREAEKQSEAQGQSPRRTSFRVHFRSTDFRREARDYVASPADLFANPGAWQFMLTFAMISIVFWPVVWVLWAFAFRGGISYRLAGLDLVRANGRPALRIQCAWRMLLIWLPVTLMFLGAVWIDLWYWSAWPDTASLWWGPWLSSGLCWLGSAYLLACAASALWTPNRAFYDRLAGVYLVPR